MISAHSGLRARAIAKGGLIKLALLSSLVLLWGTPAFATTSPTVTVTGDYSASVVGGGADPLITDMLPSPFSETFCTVVADTCPSGDTKLGTATSAVDFLALSPNGSGLVTKTIQVTFSNFSPSATVGDNLVETGTFVANYNGEVLDPPNACQDLRNPGDCIAWSGGNDPLAIALSGGLYTLDITLGNAADWTIYPTISFDLVNTPGGGQTTVPTPASLPLLGTGLLVFWAMRRRASQRA